MSDQQSPLLKATIAWYAAQDMPVTEDDSDIAAAEAATADLDAALAASPPCALATAVSERLAAYRDAPLATPDPKGARDKYGPLSWCEATDGRLQAAIAEAKR